MRKFLALGCLLTQLSIAGPALAVPTPQEPPPDPYAGLEERLAELLRRDDTLGFTPRTAVLARAALEEPEVIGERRSAALYALGATKTVTARPDLELWADQGQVDERCAAILGLGELGAEIAGADLTLIRLLNDSDRNVSACALAALLRARPAIGRARAEALAADSNSPLMSVAQAVLRWEDGTYNTGAVPYLRRLFLRWTAARDFGTVEGRSWEMVQIERLAENEQFLDQFVLMAVSRSRQAGVRDHVLTLLLEGRSMPTAIRSAVRVMPAQLDDLIASGLWAPRDGEQWAVLIDEALEVGAEKSLYRTFERAAAREELLPRVAPHLSARDDRYDGLTQRALRDLDIEHRAAAARAVGEANLTRMLPQLIAQAEDDAAYEVRAEAWIARTRMGELGAAEILHGLFIDERRDGARGNRERAAYLNAIHSARRSTLVLDLAEYLVSRLFNVADKAAQAERVALLATLQLGGRAIEQAPLMRALEDRSLGVAQKIRIAQALGRQARVEHVELLERAFPVDGQWSLNLAIAQALLENGSEEVLPLLQRAVWRGPIDRSVLAALVVTEGFGLQRLLHWAESPPTEARSEDIRRIGYAIGSWGGKPALDELRMRLGAVNGADRPALQGALMGLLAARTR